VSDGLCVAIPNDALMGSFTCTVSDDPSAVGTFGGSDVTGYLDELEFSLIAATSCALYPDGSLEFQLVGLRFALWVTGIQSIGPGRHSFEVYEITHEAIGMLGQAPDVANEPAAAFISNGFFELDRRPELGAKLGVYLEAFLDVPSGVDQVGVPCDRGQPDCGPWPYARTYCASFVNPVCTADCQAASDCAAYGGDICDAEFCYRSCSVSADCEAPLECLELPSGARVCA
jgi:hypothetical protein